MNFSYSATELKWISLFSFEYTFIHAGLITSHTGHWEMLVHWVMQVFQTLTQFITQYQKKHTHHRQQWSHHESLYILESCQAYSGRHKFVKILIFAWKLGFCHWQQILTGVFLEVMGWLCSFLLEPNVQVWIIIVCLRYILASKNGVRWKSG